MKISCGTVVWGNWMQLHAQPSQAQDQALDCSVVNWAANHGRQLMGTVNCGQIQLWLKGQRWCRYKVDKATIILYIIMLQILLSLIIIIMQNHTCQYTYKTVTLTHTTHNKCTCTCRYTMYMYTHKLMLKLYTYTLHEQLQYSYSTATAMDVHVRHITHARTATAHHLVYTTVHSTGNNFVSTMLT